MYFSDEIILISVTTEKDEIGNHRRHETERMVYGEIKSVTQKEFFAGAQYGMKDQARVDIRSMDYEGETMAEVGGKTYEIYRTYSAKPDSIELYMKEASHEQKM